ncbi:5'/3'-nucleotidase SurE [Pseudomonas fuscovaginae UPB0736]|uniref:5'/3'-nucleotidase SurE n=1 Tax=Pseudomonas asplenii TaxID=53407 RepID=UPI000287B2B3|nr:5'/3'-nucleotidase SurE [Pseudomonas fuscovaginae]UUQ65628.1 5'/3'-nucleotidase SurE [Pseudomonas fuscovaginae UPB0736]
MEADAPLFERVLLTNDDGIDAPGLKVLERIACTIAREVWVVAPLLDQSGTSSAISLHRPLRLSSHGVRRMAVDGTPSDCVAMALGHLLTHPLPDLILSGINRGSNLGNETAFSGTVGAAMTGLLFGVPSIALSQALVDRTAVPWGVALDHGAQILRQIVSMTWPRDVCLNVNFPAVMAGETPRISTTRQGKGTLRGVRVVSGQDPRGQAFHWLQLHRESVADEEHSETEALRNGHVTVTPLSFDRTCPAAL